MLIVHDCDIRETTLEFEPGLGGAIPTIAVYFNDICLIKAVAACDFTSDPCQLIICECGAVGCAVGGYVAFRRVGDLLAMLPVFSALSSDDDFERLQFEPPDYLMRQDSVGAIFSPDAYATLKSRIPEFPTISKVKPLTSSEAISIIQLEAPLQVMGRFPAIPSLDRSLILAVTEGDTDAEACAVQLFIEKCLQEELSLVTEKENGHWFPVEFHLDGPRFPAWRSFVKFEDQIAISLPPAGILVAHS